MLKIGQDATFKALGKDYTLSRLDVEAIGEFRDWIADRVDVAGKLDLAERFADKCPEQAAALFREAVDLQKQLDRFSLACPLATQLLATECGMVAFHSILLRRHHPEITSGEVLAVIASAGAELAKAREKAEGRAPGGPAGNAGRPGAQTPGSSTGISGAAASTSGAPA